ncbi:hypothetical protein [Capnocytophaga cynodegmi]|uniref:hypothetical protein n=1 Tax=Capnocytophaga cynodegmi TaxID=28189 RepID=UPI001BB3486A|nr:hypothetical protein [Capnocytophaga cynodegmi]
MRFFYVLLFFLLTMVSCSKDKDVNNEGSQSIVEQVFNAYIKDGFTGDNNEELIPPRNINNIVVGDFIPYTLTIEDTEESKYNLISVKDESTSLHSLQVDYEIYLEGADGKARKVEKPTIAFEKAGKYKFYIKPLVAGTFQLFFVFQKEGKEAMKLPKVNFNAVKITAWSHARRIGWEWVGFEQFSLNKRNFFFKIEDGNKETDVYLEPQNATQSFEVNYNNHRVLKPFEVGRHCEFYPEQARLKADPELPSSTVNITIIQRREGEREFRVTYYGVPIEDRR